MLYLIWKRCLILISCHPRRGSDTIFSLTNAITALQIFLQNLKSGGWRGFVPLFIPSEDPNQRFTLESGYFEGETQQFPHRIHPWTSWYFLPLLLCGMWERRSSPKSPWNIPFLLQLPLCQTTCSPDNDRLEFLLKQVCLFPHSKFKIKKYPVKPQHPKGIPFSASLTQGKFSLMR